ncbi:hypothetical protein SUDANB178_05427 [Streptomyces sp. enrichment culture]
MTERAFATAMAAPATGFDAMAPENVSPLVVWLGSAGSAGVTGRVFEAEGGRITAMEGRRPGPTAKAPAGHRPGRGRRPGECWRRRSRRDACTGRSRPRPAPGQEGYVSHSSTVRHNPHRARTRPCTGTLIRWWQVGQGKDTRSRPAGSAAKAYGVAGGPSQACRRSWA